MLKPLNGRVVIQIEELEEKTASGIVLPSAVKEKPQIGQVIAVAEDTAEFTSQLKVNDRVLFEKHAGSEVEYAGEKYLIIKESEIVAVVE